MQRLGNNHGGYHGERIDIRAVLRDITSDDEVGASPWPATASQPVEGVDDDDCEQFLRREEVLELERFLGCHEPKSKSITKGR